MTRIVRGNLLPYQTQYRNLQAGRYTFTPESEFALLDAASGGEQTVEWAGEHTPLILEKAGGVALRNPFDFAGRYSLRRHTRGQGYAMSGPRRVESRESDDINVGDVFSWKNSGFERALIYFEITTTQIYRFRFEDGMGVEKDIAYVPLSAAPRTFSAIEFDSRAIDLTLTCTADQGTIHPGKIIIHFGQTSQT